jgi:hypothetical protein
MPGDAARALKDALVSPNEGDSNGEPANVVDGLFAIARAISRHGKAVEDLARAVASWKSMPQGGTRDGDE